VKFSSLLAFRIHWMQRVFETFVTRISGCADAQDFRETMNVAALEFQIRSFAYFSHSADQATEPRVISNYPQDWATRYREKAYHKIDPVIRSVGTQPEPFFWPSENCSKTYCDLETNIFEEAAEFGIGRGLTVPIHDRHKQKAAMTFAAAVDDRNFVETARVYQHALQLMATCFHIHARRVFSKATIIDGVTLTKRELECLQWAARGKSAGDTAEILGIKRRTVSFHLENVRRKFEVRTVAQAIAILAVSRPDLI